MKTQDNTENFDLNSIKGDNMRVVAFATTDCPRDENGNLPFKMLVSNKMPLEDLDMKMQLSYTLMQLLKEKDAGNLDDRGISEITGLNPPGSVEVLNSEKTFFREGYFLCGQITEVEPVLPGLAEAFLAAEGPNGGDPDGPSGRDGKESKKDDPNR